MSFDVTYDPEADGADCSHCILRRERAGGPVPPEVHPGAGAVIVAEAPGETEVEKGRPLCGKSGQETMDALRGQSLERAHFHWTNSVLCRPPENDMDKLLHKLQQENSTRKAANVGKPKDQWLQPLPTPQQACRPRLLRELESYAGAPFVDPQGQHDRILNVIAMGKHSWNSIAQANDAIGQVRGGPVDGFLSTTGDYWRERWPATNGAALDYVPLHLRTMPMHHAAFVLRKPRWRQAFRVDFGRAVRWWRGQLNWKPPRIWFNPPPNDLRAFLARNEPAFGVDFETDQREPLTAQIRCLGICTYSGDDAVSIHFLSIDGVTRFYNDADQEEVEGICKAFLTNPSVRKVGHNFGYYDRMVAEARWGVRPQNVVDTILGARLADSETPKSLAYIASIHTDAPSWKKDKTALNARTDEELGVYCVTDTASDVRALPGVAAAVESNHQMHLWNFFAKNQALCVGMHRNGMHVDEAKRREWDSVLTREGAQWLRRTRILAGDANFNPNSTVQLRDLLFNKWKLSALEFTKLGDPSTGDEVLRGMLKQHSGLDKHQRRFVRSIRKVRRASKLRGTYVNPLRPNSELVDWDVLSYNEDAAADEEEALGGAVEWDPRSFEQKEADRKKEKKPGLTLPDGRVHPDYNAHGTTSMRLSSSNPNGQNWLKKLRNIIRAPAGRILLGCDQGQLELRVAAAIWKCVQYYDAFRTGGDPHLVTCKMVYGSDFETKYGPDMREKLRAFAKRFSYACAERNTPVAVLDARGSVPIKDVKVGDWTWCWDGVKYAPTRVKAVVCHGVRQCVRVTYKWRTPENTWTETSSIFTPDHLFMLRDGNYRAAGELRPGTSLMPFRRWTVGAYRVVDPFNDGGRIGEHRVARGAQPGDGTHVHHRDHNAQNNVPENLEPLTPKQHTQEHWEENPARAETLAGVNAKLWSVGRRAETNAKLTEGRVNSEKWRAAVRESASGARAILAQKRADGTVKPRKKQSSKLDPFVDKVGVLHDREVAALAGVTPTLVGMYRRKHGIAAAPMQRKNHVVVSVEPVGEHEVWDIEVDHPAHNFAIADGLFVHNCLYGASLETVHDTLTSSEDSKGNLLFPDLSIRETRRAMKAWLGANPEIQRGWDNEVAFFQAHGYLEEPIVGHRRFFRDGEDRNELLNFRCQSGGSAIVHLATHRLVEEYVPFEKWGPGTGLIQQGHDSLCVEAPVEFKDYVIRAMNECMAQPVAAFPDMPFRGDAKAAMTWDKV